jgi:Tfp pilus assembly protein PilO
MPQWIDFLSPKERKRLLRLSLVAGALILLLVFFVFFWSHSLNAVREEAGKLTADLEKITRQNDQSQLELKRWQVTRKDLEEMENSAFYSGTDSLEAFRQDLEKLFQQAGLTMPPVSYQYDEMGKKQFRRLSASFALRFSYPAFKKFLYVVEAWPRILLLDQINFQKVDSVSGILELRMILSGFYHEKEH